VRAPVDPPAEHLGDELEPVADAQHRHAEVEHPRRRHGRPLRLDRHRATGEDDALRPERLDVRQRQVRPVDLAVDPQLADPPGDQLGVLAPEVEDEDLLVVDVHVRVCSAG
jgi:hypothetical protein